MGKYIACPKKYLYLLSLWCDGEVSTHFCLGSGLECSPFRLDDVVVLITRGGVDTVTLTLLKLHNSTDHSSARVSSLRVE